MPQCCAKAFGIERSALVALEQIQRDVEADAARADDHHVPAGLHAAGEHVHVARDALVLDAGDGGLARVDAGGEHHLVELRELGFARGVIEQHLRAGAAQALGVVGDRLGELLLAGDALGEVELAAQLGRFLEQHHFMAALGGDCRAGKAGRAAADDGDALLRACRAR